MFTVDAADVTIGAAKVAVDTAKDAVDTAMIAVDAGDKCSISHCLFCGGTAAVAPNRMLHAGIFLSFVLSSLRVTY